MTLNEKMLWQMKSLDILMILLAILRGYCPRTEIWKMRSLTLYFYTTSHKCITLWLYVLSICFSALKWCVCTKNIFWCTYFCMMEGYPLTCMFAMDFFNGKYVLVLKLEKMIFWNIMNIKKSQFITTFQNCVVRRLSKFNYLSRLLIFLAKFSDNLCGPECFSWLKQLLSYTLGKLLLHKVIATVYVALYHQL